MRQVESAGDLPDAGAYDELREPWVEVQIITPTESIGNIMQLAEGKRGEYKRQEYLSPQRVMITYEFPFNEILYDFYDKLKSVTRGYGTMDYHVIGFRPGDLVKLDILVNHQPVDALSLICHRSRADQRGRRFLIKLRREIGRQQFEVRLQAAIGRKVIAAETIKAFRKDVTAKCYGGDVTRKRKAVGKAKSRQETHEDRRQRRDPTEGVYDGAGAGGLKGVGRETKRIGPAPLCSRCHRPGQNLFVRNQARL